MAQWQAYYAIAPFGSEKVVEMIGELCALMFNMHREKGVRATSSSDFTGAWTPPVEVDQEFLQAKINAMMTSLAKQG